MRKPRAGTVPEKRHFEGSRQRPRPRFLAPAIPGLLVRCHVIPPTHPLTVLDHSANVLQRLEVLGVHRAKLHYLVSHLQTLKREGKTENQARG